MFATLNARRIMTMTDDVKALVDELNADADPGFCTSSTSTLSRRAAAALTAQAEEIERLNAENERIWRERNIAVTKVKGWEETLVVEQLPPRVLQVREWGPGEGEQVSIPQITPRRLTEILDELAALKAAQEVGR